jgi:hypothetical protein
VTSARIDAIAAFRGGAWSTPGERGSLFGLAPAGLRRLVSGVANVSPLAVCESVGELLAGSDSAEDAEDAAEAVEDAERGGDGDDGEHCASVCQVELTGEPVPSSPQGPP